MGESAHGPLCPWGRCASATEDEARAGSEEVMGSEGKQVAKGQPRAQQNPWGW